MNSTEHEIKFAKEHVYLIFDVVINRVLKIESAFILINKKKDFEKLKNPHLLEEQVVKEFIERNPNFKKNNPQAFYIGDLIPKLPVTKSTSTLK